MDLGWKVLVPVSLVWVCVVTVIRVLRDVEGTPAWQVMTFGSAVVLVLAIAGYLATAGRRRRAKSQDGPQIPMAGSGHPVPPADLVVPPAPPRQRTHEPTAQIDRNGRSATKEEAPHGSA
jgi:NADH-quinone oxidoreductase subunit H